MTVAVDARMKRAKRKRRGGSAALTTGQVAERLGCSVNHVRDMIRRGDIRAANIGTKAAPVYRVSRRVFAEFLRECEVTACEPFSVEGDS